MIIGYQYGQKIIWKKVGNPKNAINSEHLYTEGPYHIWQCTQYGNIKGIKNNVDINLSYKEY